MRFLNTLYRQEQDTHNTYRQEHTTIFPVWCLTYTHKSDGIDIIKATRGEKMCLYWIISSGRKTSFVLSPLKLNALALVLTTYLLR